ncbi:hypothetical protein BLA24_20540 [Streptomyces cinnamoneus]|uniref:Uncharacterized protein n=1 Tax=Streptomyces cinnamoneus TaxID=53446 RepID=A0A2G1XFJ1_STRCJ|nr:hypothetical protein [Streptomyces cinnamoneus]PHQ50002.1 hypothetical protein BLA24_20540 [Streptomyces cinnamoneus]PPT13220.1 hypothetical protein CYQ11_10240 [Streptomyces cinnamoneus]
MAVAGPTGPALSREEVDRALARLAAEHEAVESSLLALQDHAGRRLLEGAELNGTTLSRWTATEQLITQLWVYFDAYTDALESARELRGRRRWPTQTELSELTDLLSGTALILPSGPPAATALALGPAARLSERMSLTELVERMNGWYAQALDVVVTADAVWSALPARIDLLAAELQRTRALAHSVGVRPGEHPSGDDLEEIARELAALRSEVISDPLAFWAGASPSAAPGGGRPDTTRYDRAARALEDVRREVEAVLDVRQDAEQRLMRVRDVLSRADRTLGEARLARTEVLSKIAAYEVPAVSGPPTALYEQLSAAAEHRRHARWHRLSPLLDGLEQRADEELLRARESLTAVTAPLAVRAELRGRLDAYRAKASRLGLAEDLFVVERYDVARRMLWSAPCDLVAAENAVLRYQRAVTGTPDPPAGPAAAGPADHRGDA